MLISIAFDGASSEGKRYGAAWTKTPFSRQLSLCESFRNCVKAEVFTTKGSFVRHAIAHSQSSQLNLRVYESRSRNLRSQNVSGSQRFTHAAFGVFRHNIGQYTFYLPFTKKRVAFPDWLSALTCNDVTFFSCKNTTGNGKIMLFYFI